MKLGLWSTELRRWQAEAYDLCLDKVKASSKDFLCEATPGGGKTRFALRVIHKFLQVKYAERVVIVVPTDHLKRQWAEEAFRYSIELDPNFENSQQSETKDFSGVVLTYAQIGLNPEVHRLNTETKNTIVVLDEIHHAGDALTWGAGIRIAFTNAVFRLGLSGTPFRSDANTIPFVTYKNKVSEFDYSYPYEEAVIDKVCRPVYFPAYDGEMTWTTNDISYTHSFADILDDAKSSERLKTALDPNGDFLKQMIIDANNKLTEIREREYHTDAAGLILAVDQKHAKQIAELVGKLIGQKPIVVTSDEKESSRKIKKFRDSSERWIVAVKMISEGVDIPRLRVGVYATNVTSELFFRQAVGRYVRILAHLETQEAFIYIPRDPRIIGFAETIEEEREHALDKATRDNDTAGSSDISDGDKEQKEKKDFKPIRSVVTNKEQLEFFLDDKISKMFNIPKELAGNVSVNVVLPEEVKEEPVPVFEQKRLLREEISRLAKLYAKNRGNGNIDWEIAHKDWMKQGGKNIEKETVKDLEKRKNWLEKNI